jgi:phage I-like protein
MKRFAVGALMAAVLVLSSGCSSKVDRAGTKKLITDKLASAGVTGDEANCVAKLLDNYSDKELTALDKEFTKSATAASDLGKKFQDDTAECTKGTNVKAMVDQLKTGVATMTPDQEKCATDFLMAMSGAELRSLNADTAKATEIGQQLGTKCLTS